MPIFEGLNVIA